jgi:tRNA threonylcarbamoyladenosine modification (KEOPS) complex  Pcc1 subunit
LKAKATVRLPIKTKKELAALVSALTPEVNKQVGIRSKTTMATEGLTLMLSFEAEDTVALRAALNAYLRWINSTMNVLEVAAEK